MDFLSSRRIKIPCFVRVWICDVRSLFMLPRYVHMCDYVMIGSTLDTHHQAEVLLSLKHVMLFEHTWNPRKHWCDFNAFAFDDCICDRHDTDQCSDIYKVKIHFSKQECCKRKRPNWESLLFLFISCFAVHNWPSLFALYMVDMV